MHHNSHRQSSTTVSTLPLRRQFNEVTNASGPRTPILPRVLGSVSTNSSPQQHVTKFRCQNNGGKGKAIGMCNDEMTPALQIILLRSSVGLRAAKLCGQGSSA